MPLGSGEVVKVAAGAVGSPGKLLRFGGARQRFFLKAGIALAESEMKVTPGRGRIGLRLLAPLVQQARLRHINPKSVGVCYQKIAVAVDHVAWPDASVGRRVDESGLAI